METTVNIKSNSKGLILIALASIFCCLGIISLILHISPLTIFEALADFAVHHYFLAGFLFLLLAMVCLKFYSKSNEHIKSYISGGISRAARRRAAIANMKKRINISSCIDKSTYIRKEKVTSLKFKSEDVLQTPQERQIRFETLKRALSLGNLYKQKVIISFKAQDDLNHTLGTVWHADEHHVSLKGGATIPVNRILKIEI